VEVDPPVRPVEVDSPVRPVRRHDRHAPGRGLRVVRLPVKAPPPVLRQRQARRRPRDRHRRPGHHRRDRRQPVRAVRVDK
jgi:hypothetical protein